ncbi:pectinesterase 1-like [Cornus florida]|uniref:pectinesterase 1-like n=1 Tax=Cornus florida TaxID=4283 RepID=UPI00289EBA91|nr:pectinesterase 1-like [Cornus florida]
MVGEIIMAPKKTLLAGFTVVLMSILSTSVLSDDNCPIPAEKGQVESWFKTNVKPFNERRGTLNPAIVKAEGQPKVMKVCKDGSGEFKTVMEAIKKIPDGNTQRVIIQIGPGNYTEKITIDRKKPFVTLMGTDPKNKPFLIFGCTAALNGTAESAAVIVDSDYFMAVNINFKNSAPRPEVGAKNKQALALRLGGDMSAIYNCNMYGFQDTLFDYKGRHFFKDCYIEGTCDFVFGDAKSLYVNTELHVIPGDNVAFITANGKKDDQSDTGYSFVHCNVTGVAASNGILGRAWFPHSKAIFSYSTMSEVVKAEGWSENLDHENEKTVYYGEFKNNGPGADTKGRVKFAKQLSEAEAKPYISLAYIEASKWLLPCDSAASPSPSGKGSSLAEAAPTKGSSSAEAVPKTGAVQAAPKTGTTQAAPKKGA